MRIQELPVDAVFGSLNSRPDGLTDGEAARRLIEYGPNRVQRVGTQPLWRRFSAQFTHLFALVLLIAAAMAAVAEAARPGEGMGMLAIAILVVVLVNGAFSFWQEYRSERTLESLMQLLPPQVKVRRNGNLAKVLADTLVPGDVIVLVEGDSVPADCRIVRALGAQVNMAAVTGESVPGMRGADPDANADLTTAINILPAGTSLVVGDVEAVVFATGMRTQLGGIAHMAQTSGERPSPLQQEVARLSRIIAALALGLGVGFFAIGISLGQPLWHAAIFAIGLMVANVPEGLLPTLTLALAMAAQRLAGRNIMVRKLAAVETLGSATVICTDKTGTLTENRMRVMRAFVAGGVIDADRLGEAGLAGRMVLATAAACQSLEVVGGRLAGDPMEIALVEMAGGLPGEQAVDGIPFDATRKRMSRLLSSGMLHVKGAPESILPLCTMVAEVDHLRPLTETDRIAFRTAEGLFAQDGMRVLALACRQVSAGDPKDRWEENLVLVALTALEDPPRPEVAGAVARCKHAGIKVIMVTGDHPRTAEAIARQIGLVRTYHPHIIVGDQLQRMSKTQLQLALDAPEILFARTRADQKWRIVDALQAKGEVVAVTGDGVNDAPALKQADVGIALGASGTDVARQAADMVLLDDDFASIVDGVEEGRAVFDNIRKFLTYILTSNIPEIVPYLAFAAFGVPLALTVPQILAIDLGTDMLPALALGADKPDKDVMNRPPRARGERLIGPGLLARAYGFLGMIQAVGAMAAFFAVLLAGGWIWGMALPPTTTLYREATTACLVTVVVMQMANLFACRSYGGFVFRKRPMDNHLIVVALFVEAALIVGIVYLPLGNLLFGTTRIGIGDWLRGMVFASFLLAAEEARKVCCRTFES